MRHLEYLKDIKTHPDPSLFVKTILDLSRMVYDRSSEKVVGQILGSLAPTMAALCCGTFTDQHIVPCLQVLEIVPIGRSTTPAVGCILDAFFQATKMQEQYYFMEASALAVIIKMNIIKKYESIMLIKMTDENNNLQRDKYIEFITSELPTSRDHNDIDENEFEYIIDKSIVTFMLRLGHVHSEELHYFCRFNRRFKNIHEASRIIAMIHYDYFYATSYFEEMLREDLELYSYATNQVDVQDITSYYLFNNVIGMIFDSIDKSNSDSQTLFICKAKRFSYFNTRDDNPYVVKYSYAGQSLHSLINVEKSNIYESDDLEYAARSSAEAFNALLFASNMNNTSIEFNRGEIHLKPAQRLLVTVENYNAPNIQIFEDSGPVEEFMEQTRRRNDDFPQEDEDENEDEDEEDNEELYDE